MAKVNPDLIRSARLKKGSKGKRVQGVASGSKTNLRSLFGSRKASIRKKSYGSKRGR